VFGASFSSLTLHEYDRRFVEWAYAMDHHHNPISGTADLVAGHRLSSAVWVTPMARMALRACNGDPREWSWSDTLSPDGGGTHSYSMGPATTLYVWGSDHAFDRQAVPPGARPLNPRERYLFLASRIAHLSSVRGTHVDGFQWIPRDPPSLIPMPTSTEKEPELDSGLSIASIA
jgi:hypothetical protein